MSTKLIDNEQKILAAHPAFWDQLISSLEAIIGDPSKGDAVGLVQAFAYIDRATREGLQKQMERLTGQSLWLGIHSTNLLDTFVKEHSSLIKSVQRQHVEKIGAAISRGIRDGRLHKDIVKDIRARTAMEKRRAQLIARNAPLQYSGALTRHHQISAGIKQYYWQTSHDERVRESHRGRDGKIFDWDGPGPHPRSEVNCRCDAVPVFIKNEIAQQK
jgi:SPP1 gp7 family putative phage head morphogenesis protein